MPRPLPLTLTTLDLLKTWALVLLLVDMTGFFLFPVREVGPDSVGDPNLWFRVLGRLSVPVWFFLIGYARSRDLSPPIWIGGIISLIANIVCGWFIFPLDALFTIIIIRLVIDRIARFSFERMEHLVLVLVGCAMFAVPLALLLDFGPLAFVLALTGFAVRCQNDPAYPLLGRFLTRSILYWASFIGMAVLSGLFFPFDRAQSVVAAIGAGLVLHLLMTLKIEERPDFATHLGPLVTRLVQFMGRHTLLIYVLTGLSLQMLCWAFGLGLPLYRFMDWEWTAHETFADMYATVGTQLPPQ